MNPLREKLEVLVDKFAQYEEHSEYHYDCDTKDGHVEYDADKLITDMLDTVTAALPAEKTYRVRPTKGTEGYNLALTEARNILQAAKENK